MKITAGLGHVDDYPSFVRAGADEVFCGYVPARWYDQFQMRTPLNRREVRYAHVQIGGRNEMKVLRSMVDAFGVPVALTFNALSYLPGQYAMIAEIIGQCVEDGFTDYILADPALICYLNEVLPDLRVHLSGEAFTMNPDSLALFDKPFVRRIIFHRHLSVPEISQCIQSLPQKQEFEAFILNERCHFHGALCVSLHCDELSPLCQVPYRLHGISSSARKLPAASEQDPALFGSTGCGVCALYDLFQAGITHLKIVGRGNSPENMTRDIQMLKKAMACCEQSSSKEQFLQAATSFFRADCLHNCYYS